MSTVTLSQRELKRRRKLGAELVAPSPFTLKAALETGDILTKLSALVFGLGNIVHKQYVKGLLFLAGEVGFILFMIFSGAHNLSMLPSLGWRKESTEWVGAKLCRRSAGARNPPNGWAPSSCTPPVTTRSPSCCTASARL